MILSRIVLAAAVLGGCIYSVHARELCRCEATFEKFYDRRNLRHSSAYLPYAYDGAYMNEQGYYVVEGIIVLPDDSEYCNAHSVRVRKWMALYGDGHRDLLEGTADVAEEALETEQERGTRNLNGKGGRKGSKSSKRGKGGSKSSKKRQKGGKGGTKSSSKSQGYYYYGGKGKGLCS